MPMFRRRCPARSTHLIDQLRDRFQRQLPGADLLLQNVYDALMTDVTNVKDLGSGVIGGTECDHFAFRTKETDWQIWIAQGPNPYPCRYVITSKGVDQAPQFTMVVRDWKAGAGVAGGDFAFKPPAGAKKLDAKDIAGAEGIKRPARELQDWSITMTMSRTLKIVLLAGLVSLVDPEAVMTSAGTDSFSIISPAQAVVGRPLTPVSVAGVARRTTRRCAAGVYNC